MALMLLEGRERPYLIFKSCWDSVHHCSSPSLTQVFGIVMAQRWQGLKSCEDSQDRGSGSMSGSVTTRLGDRNPIQAWAMTVKVVAVRY